MPPSALIDQSLGLQERYSGLVYLSEKLNKENNSLKEEIKELKHELDTYKKHQSTIELKKHMNIPLKILFVEDNEVTRTIGSKIVNSIGHNITTCTNGFEAIGQVVCSDYDAVVIDYNLGAHSPNGMKLGKILSEKGHKGITVIVSCDSSIENDIIDKPLTLDSWKQFIHTLSIVDVETKS